MQRIQQFLIALVVVALMPITAFAQLQIDTYRPYNPESAYLFEAPKLEPTGFDGQTIYLGAAFTQQFQALDHEAASGVELADLGADFNLATANLYLGASLTDGIRVNLETYLSSRNHPEAWVKGGYVLVDGASFLGVEAVDNIMEFVTVKAGHFEINYGDAHFRRSDNGQAILNPFVGNYIMDSFTTEVGAEIYVRSNGLLAMVALSGGELNPSVDNPDDEGMAVYGKLGFDRQLQEDVRVRLTGSAYTSAKNRTTLYGGDRAGARYYSIMYPAEVTGRDPFSNPRLNPRFGNDLTAFQINPFVQFKGLELFGVLEWASGSDVEDGDDRSVSQYAVEALYRFMPNDALYVGGRYNVVNGDFVGPDSDVSSTRIQVGGGWFVTPNILLKGEYVQQSFDDYPETNLFHEGEFDGFVIEGVIAF